MSAAGKTISMPSGGIAAAVADAVASGLILLATVFTNAGAAIVTNRMIQAGTAPKNIGWGTGTNAAAVTDTALQTEAAPTTAGGRTVGTESRTTITNTNDNYQVVGTVTGGRLVGDHRGWPVRCGDGGQHADPLGLLGGERDLRRFHRLHLRPKASAGLMWLGLHTF
jgi:hypothetical protein